MTLAGKSVSSLAGSAAMQMLMDREAIKELQSAYAWHAARGELAEIIALFTQNGVFEAFTGGARHRAEGREAIREMLSQIRPNEVAPVIGNAIIRVEGEAAHGSCAMFSLIAPRGAPPFAGYYLDRFRRAGPGWRFSERRYFLYTPIFEVPEQATGPQNEP